MTSGLSERVLAADPRAVTLIPESVARKHQVFPLAADVKQSLDEFLDHLRDDNGEYRPSSIESGGLMVRPRLNEESPGVVDEYEVYLRVGTI